MGACRNIEHDRQKAVERDCMQYNALCGGCNIGTFCLKVMAANFASWHRVFGANGFGS